MPWCLKSPAYRLFTHLFVQAESKVNMKAPWHWPLWGESTVDPWILRKMFPFDDVIMRCLGNGVRLCSRFQMCLNSSTVCPGWYQRKHHSPALLALCEGNSSPIVSFPQKGPVTRKTFPCHKVTVLMIFAGSVPMQTREHYMGINFKISI